MSGQADIALRKRLLGILATDPGKVLSELDLMEAVDVNRAKRAELYAGFRIDAGAATSNLAAVEKGVSELEALLKSGSPSPTVRYNLANGLVAATELRPSKDKLMLEWDTRRRARSLFRGAASDAKLPPEIASQSLTNLAGILRRSNRSIEALDTYLEALTTDPSNGVAAGNASTLLFRFAESGQGDVGRMRQLASHFARIAQANEDQVALVAGLHATEAFAKLDSSLPRLSRSRMRGRFRQFVAEHRLALCVSIEALPSTSRKWDTLHLPPIVESISTSTNEAPVVFAQFNIIKENYLAARRLVFEATQESRAPSANVREKPVPSEISVGA